MNKTTFRDTIPGTMTILGAICLVVTLILAFVYGVTKEPIAHAKVMQADNVRAALLPAADSFEEVAQQDWPEGVSEVYRAGNLPAYVLRSSAKGFDGQVVFMMALSEEGDVIAIEMFEHNETPGLGTKIGNAEYLAKYYGAQDPQLVDSVSGASKTSNALKQAVLQAKAAVNMVKE